MPEHRKKWGVPIFADSHPKSVTMATSIEQLLKQGRIDDAYLYMYLY